MNVYIFQAALLCSDCGTAMRAKLINSGAPDTGDSDDFPQGPYGDGGGEADGPQHCDHCHMHLENPLTPDGVAYVQEVVNEHRGLCWQAWAEFYGIRAQDDDDEPSDTDGPMDGPECLDYINPAVKD